MHLGKEIDLLLVQLFDKQELRYGRASPSRLRHEWFGLIIMHDGDFLQMRTP
jgi:hypothetical protein